MRALLPLLALAGCQATGPQAVPFAAPGVEPGLAVCLAAIGRADVAAAPDAPMSNGEIAGLLACTSQRAGG